MWRWIIKWEALYIEGDVLKTEKGLKWSPTVQRSFRDWHAEFLQREGEGLT